MSKNYELIFSMIGDFSDLEATPLLMQNFTSIFTGIGALPSTIQMASLSSSGATTSYRPQFISIQNNYTVNFLPDRVEIVFKQKMDENLSLEEKSSIANTIFKLLADVINNRSNRMVFILKSYFENKCKGSLIDKSRYFSNDDFVEWRMRTVHRRSILVNGNNEIINVVIEQNHPEQGIRLEQSSSVKVINGTHCHLDINTVQFNRTNRFLVENYSEFILQIKDIVNETIRTIEGAYNNGDD